MVGLDRSDFITADFVENESIARKGGRRDALQIVWINSYTLTRALQRSPQIFLLI
jgi:hypothetical protein